MLLVICNFSNVEYDAFRVGVPLAGKYKEIFNSDDAEIGGGGSVNPRIRQSTAVPHDERKQSIQIRIPPLAVSVFAYRPGAAPRGDNRTAKNRKKSAPASSGAKTAKAGAGLARELAETIEREERTEKVRQNAAD